ncbi:MAG: NHL repeat-containing protein, partial [Rectinema sp.]|nr:NHL repeat-containing protein [Rectinema sp.]
MRSTVPLGMLRSAALIARKGFIVLCLLCEIFLLAGSIGCNALHRANGAQLEIRLSMDRNARTLAPVIDLDIVSYDIHGSGPNNASFDIEQVNRASYVLTDLIPGEWTIFAEGRNAEGKIMVRSPVETVTLSIGETESVSLLCVPLSGYGMLNLSLSWPAEALIQPQIEATLTLLGQDPIPLAFAIEGNSAQWNSDPATGIATGCYTLSLILRDAARPDTPLWTKVETVMIYKDATTAASWPLTLQEVDSSGFPVLVLGVKSDTKSPIHVDLAGGSTELRAGSLMTVAATGQPAPDSWRWYLDGSVIQWANSSSLALGDTLKPGSSHALTAIGTKGDSAGSAELRFRIRTVSVSTLAGSGTAGAADGIGASAQFFMPQGVAVDGAGVVYVADTGNHKIRKIEANGIVSTIAGSGLQGSTEGTATVARFCFPSDLVISAAGTVYVADTENHKIRKISPEGVVSTLAGSGTAGDLDGTGAAARFNRPSGIAIDASGVLYIADTGNHKIKKITPEGVVTTIAGSVSGYEDGPLLSARFSQPADIAIDSSGALIVVDTGNHRIRKIQSGQVTTVAGSGGIGTTDGPALQATFQHPSGIAIDSEGCLYVSDSDNNMIRKISPAGTVITLAGTV